MLVIRPGKLYILRVTTPICLPYLSKIYSLPIRVERPVDDSYILLIFATRYNSILTFDYEN